MIPHWLRHPILALKASKPPAALTAPEPDPPRYDRIPGHPSVGMTPETLTTLLREAESGDMKSQIELFDDVLEKDLTVTAVRQVRKLGVALCDYDVVPKDNSRAAKTQTEFIKDVMAELSAGEVEQHRADFLTFDDLMMALLDCTGKGFAAPLLNWETEGKHWRVASAKHIEQRQFLFGKPGDDKYDPYDIRIRTEEFPIDGEPLSPYRFLTMYYKGQSAYPARAGLLRGTSWYYLFKNFGFKSFVMYAELFGIPMRVGKYDPMAPADKEILQQAVLALGQDFAAVISKGSEIEILDHMKSGSSDVHLQLITACNAEITKGWLGQTATTEATPGKLGDEDAKDQVRADIKKADAKALQSTVQSKFVAPLCRFNFGDVLCNFEIHYEEDEDLETQSLLLQRVAKIAPLPLKYIYDKFQIPEPREGEAVTQAHLAPDKGAAFTAELKDEGGKKKSDDA